MSDYIKGSNFTSKDILPTGDSNKIIKGTELDVEFTAIASAIESKANKSSPVFTGTPTAPNPAEGTNNTQIATTSWVNAAIDADITALGLGTMSTQGAGAVAITGGTIADTTVNGFTVGSNAEGSKTISTEEPSGGADGDIWYKVSA